MEILRIKEKIREDFVKATQERYPKKAYGFFLSDKPDGDVESFILFEEDQRDSWKDLFEAYGNYYVRNHNAGFLASPEEMYRINKKIEESGKSIVGVFHSHLRHPAIFATVDVQLHPSPRLWHLIISLRNFDLPQIKAFKISKDNKVEELFISYVEEG